jgi:hypothetical protein
MKSSLIKIITAASALLAAPASAQDPEIPRFEEVTVETIRPDGVPTVERAAPDQVILRHAQRLPSPPDAKTLARLDDLARPLVLALAAVRVPPRPYRPDPMVFKGHAAWLSAHADASAPLLVTTSEWLRDADSIFILPPDPDQPRGGVLNAAVRARFAKFESSTPGQEARDLLARKDGLVELVVVKRDPQRNLALLAPKTRGALTRPARGLALFPFRDQPITHLFGVSPAAATLLSNAHLLGRPTNPALQYYLTSSFVALFGAPVVSPDGAALTLTAGLNPDVAGASLVIPPGALSAFVAEVQGVPDPNAKKIEELGEADTLSKPDTLAPVR